MLPPDGPPAASHVLVERAFRRHRGEVLATLIRQLGDFELAEDSLQDALAAALVAWPDNQPTNAAAWLTTTARRKAIDRLRRARTARTKQDLLRRLERWETQPEEPDVDTQLHDDQLKLVFTCCHPALSAEARIALTLRAVGGLSTPEIARAFLVSETTMAQRLVRAKRKIKEAAIPYRVPADHELTDRLGAVLLILYLIFNEGYSATSDAAYVRRELTAEAIQLAEHLAALMPDEPEVSGLLALMLAHDARSMTRLDDAGGLVLLEEQDRSQWDAAKITRAGELLRSALRRGAHGPYQIQAAIALIHAEAPSAADTDWREIVVLYDRLYALQPSPVVELNRAVAVAMADGAEAGLRLLDQIEGLAGYQWLHSARGEFLARSGRTVEAIAEFESAISLATNEQERRSLQRRLSALA